MRIGKVSSGAEYRIDEQFQNLLIYRTYSYPNWKNSENLLIFQVVNFWKFFDFPIWKIPKISMLKIICFVSPQSPLHSFLNYLFESHLRTFEYIVICSCWRAWKKTDCQLLSFNYLVDRGSQRAEDIYTFNVDFSTVSLPRDGVIFFKTSHFRHKSIKLFHLLTISYKN